MKIHLTSPILIAATLAACAFTPLSAAPKAKPAIVYRVSNTYPQNNQPVTHGSSRAEVLASMGPPAWEITSDIWVYHRFHAIDLAQADRDGCTNLLVTFTGNRVSDLKLANQSALEIYAASPKTRQRELVVSGN